MSTSNLKASDDVDAEVSDSSRPPTPGRRDSESSTERSVYAAEPEAGESAARATAGEELHFYNTTWHRSLQICRKDTAGNRVPVYFAEVSTFTPSKPDVQLRQDRETGAVVGGIKMRFSRSMHLCVGDPNDTAAHWEDLVSSKLPVAALKYDLKIPVPEAQDGGAGVRHLVWTRTKDTADGVKGVHKASVHNYRITDADSGCVVAVYLENSLKSWMKRGKLVVHAPLEPSTKLWLVLATTGVLERARRRALQSGARGGGS